MTYADFRCDLAAGFLATVCFGCFLPDIGISISFFTDIQMPGSMDGLKLADFVGTSGPRRATSPSRDESVSIAAGPGG
jgi:hypothetical protein